MWLVVDGAHYFLSVAQVALVVDRLSHGVRDVVLPPVEGDLSITPKQVWIKHRTPLTHHE